MDVAFDHLRDVLSMIFGLSVLESILSEDPYEETAKQLLEQAPRSLEYVPDPMELEDHVPVYIPEPEHPEDLVPAEDEAPIKAYITESSAAVARQPGSTMARRVDHNFIDTVDTKVRDTKRRTMAAVEVVNLRVSYQADVRRRESLESEAYSRSLEARIRVLETQAYRHEWQRQDADDRAIEHIMRTQTLETGACVDTLEDTGEVRFGKWGKLNPRYVGPSKVMEKVRDVAYKLKLPKELSRVHNTFHVSNLKKCHADETIRRLLVGLMCDDKLHLSRAVES
ncbi:hypothetical protein Tco_1058955 [Tanacetum coccineum]